MFTGSCLGLLGRSRPAVPAGNVSTSRLLRSRPGLHPLASQAASQIQVVRLEGDTFAMPTTGISIYEYPNQVGFRSLVESCKGDGLEAEISLEILGDLPHQTIEGLLGDQVNCALLILPDLLQGSFPRTGTTTRLGGLTPLSLSLSLGS